MIPPDQPILPPPQKSVWDELSLLVQRLPSWLFAGISLVVIFILYQFVGGLLTILLFGMDLSGGNVQAFRLATMAGQILFLLVPTVILAKLRFPNLPNVFRFQSINLLEILLIVLAVFALQQLMQGFLMLQESVPISFPPFVQKMIDQIKEMMAQMYRMLTKADSPAEFLFVVLVIAVTPAICEELLFRGLIQRTLEEPEKAAYFSPAEQRRKGAAAAVAAGVIFGMYHVNPFTLVPLAVLGIFFGYVVHRSQNIMTAIVAHFVNNFVACLAIYLQLDDAFVAIAPMESPSPQMLTVNAALCLVVFVASTYYFVRITNRVRPSADHIMHT